LEIRLVEVSYIKGKPTIYKTVKYRKSLQSHTLAYLHFGILASRK
jgi:hypothetical protein